MKVPAQQEMANEGTQKAAARLLIESGERERLKSLLRQRLVECGWRDQVKMKCKEIVREHGAEVTLDDIISGVTPSARALVPDTVKKEMVQKIKTFLTQQQVEGIETVFNVDRPQNMDN